jgi:hypothetical protein
MGKIGDVAGKYGLWRTSPKSTSFPQPYRNESLLSAMLTSLACTHSQNESNVTRREKNRHESREAVVTIDREDDNL